MITENQTPPEIQAVLRHQEAMAAAQSTVDQLRKAIDGQQRKINALHAASAEIEALALQREDLLADIAIGQDKSAELKELNAQVEQRKKAMASKSMADIEQTKAGLTRKLELAVAELEKLQGENPRLMRDMLLASATALGAGYVVAAKELIRLHERIEAQLQMYVAHGGHRYIGAVLGLDIPSFELDSVRPHALLMRPTHIALSERTHGQSMASVQAEVDSLRALGVVIE